MNNPIRVTLDTEFNAESNDGIELISIALVKETGEEYYAVSDEFDLSKCSIWLRNNVVRHLPKIDNYFDAQNSKRKQTWKSRATIASEIKEFFYCPGQNFQIWTYFGAYDFVAFCELLGGFMDLPRNVSKFDMDLAQRMADLGLKKSDLPSQTGTQHDALEDARWEMECLKYMDNKYPEWAGR